MPTQAEIQKAYLQGVRSVTDEVTIGILEDALQSGDIGAALEVIDLEPAAFDNLRTLLVQTYADAGVTETAKLDGVRWNSANPRVEQYAREDIGGKITLITNDSILAVREVIGDGYAFGRSPRRMALDIVGRVSANGVRTGGIVGLNQQQAQWVINMRRVLETNPQQALRYTRRDRRFDRLLRKGEPLTQTQIDNIIRTYSNRLLETRGLTIAITERGAAQNAGKIEAYKQAADKYGIGYDRIVKQWVYTNRAKEPRTDHIAMNGAIVKGADTPFYVNGIPMAHPHDPFAPPGEVINCRCQVKLWLE